MSDEDDCGSHYTFNPVDGSKENREVREVSVVHVKKPTTVRRPANRCLLSSS